MVINRNSELITLPKIILCRLWYRNVGIGYFTDTTTAITRDLVQIIRNNVIIDWTVKESVKANLRRLVKRLLRKYGYPPEKQEKATVLQQAELLCRDWAA
ncbi:MULTISPECIES: type I restriction enzyme endonuclease domain-containing protein [unclassified Tolypothrix]|uniref:type I restriction enzyme endonuclease domain-containing protein n=1 Tax=unclassified Tolypothrix TaxID=2649714 RepID=UPI0005EAB59A|nr:MULTISPECIES: type I restriction enzyme endonuclease domain-containing protein [unclassified Tolypothrix]EKE98171.1 hypothetical protein FDUTEX481_04188 [Tolypothrix sp. PCC 7601]BAY95808.1 hypothetical protein NIES3275_78850 [Microchaete diplosiphon NIES-3275]